MELSPVQRRIRDFYFKEGLGAPPEVTHVHGKAIVPDQRLFSLEHLRRHLNDPMLDINFVNVFAAGKPVDLTEAHLYKYVQRRKIGFVDHAVLQRHLEQGAACVLEGLDILEPDINELAAALDRAHAARSATRRHFSRNRATRPIAATSTPTTCSSCILPAKSAGACIAGNLRAGWS
jgi:hypothetical protein